MQPRTREYKNVLDSEDIGRLLIKLSGPVFMGMFVQTMYNVISTIFIGRYVGPLGIAGLSIAFPLQMFGFGVGSLSGIGGMSLISRALGARETERAEKALGNGITLAFALSAFILIALLPFLNFWLRLIGASEEVLPFARDYMTYVGIAILFQIVSTSLLNFARRRQRPRRHGRHDVRGASQYFPELRLHRLARLGRQGCRPCRAHRPARLRGLPRALLLERE